MEFWWKIRTEIDKTQKLPPTKNRLEKKRYKMSEERRVQKGNCSVIMDKTDKDKKDVRLKERYRQVSRGLHCINMVYLKFIRKVFH